jgi:ABC-2 type transport system permease protein
MSSPARLAAIREIRTRVSRPSFMVFTALLCAAIVAGGFLFSVLNDDSQPTYDVGTLGAVPELFEPALEFSAQQADVGVSVASFDTRAAADAALDDGDIDVILAADDGALVWQGDESDVLAPVIDQAWRTAGAAAAASDAGLDDAQVAAILDPPPLTSEIVDPDDGPGVGLLVGFASAVLLFISITTFGSYVLTGVVEEKSTGVVEVLLSHMKPHQLLGGKVFGIGAVALVQFTAAVLAGLVSLRVSGIDVPSELWVGLPVTILWFIGGFLLYSTLFALAGSFVSRMEDAQSAAAPITTAFTMGYILVFTFGGDPEGVVARVLSILPPFAPLLMPLRMVTGAASVVEIVVAAVLLALAVWGMIRLAGSVYSRTLLHRGSRLTWREALRRQPSAAT